MPWTEESTLPGLRVQGYDQLAVHCSTCRRIAILRLNNIAPCWRRGESLASVAKRLICDRCGERSDTTHVNPERRSDLVPKTGARHSH